ncbi:MAG: hypothetical protein ACP5HJ_00525 [Candidatus Micrarchaeia archaeon]
MEIREMLFYSFLGISFLFSFLVFGFLLYMPNFLKFFLILLSGIFAYFAYFLFKFDYIAIPLLTQKSKRVKTGAQRYWFSPTGDVLVTKIGNIFYASIFLRIHSYSSYTEKNDEEKVEFVRLWERAISSSEQPIGFSSVIFYLNRESYLSSINERLIRAQRLYEEKKEKGSQEEIERARGEVAMWRNILEHIKQTPSRAQVTIAVITQKGENEESAIANARSVATNIALNISAILGVEVTQMNQHEIETCIEAEKIMPSGEVVIK